MTFSSPFLTSNLERGQLLRHLENAPNAISYHLDRAIPRGSIICAYYPKGILGSILPAIAKEKNCKIISVQGTKQATAEFLKAGLLANSPITEADIFLTEPDGLSADGALVLPHEKLPHNEFIAVSSILQWTKQKPSTHDVIPIHKTITELGIYTLEQLEINAASLALPLPRPLPQPLQPASIPSPILPTRPQAP